MKAKTALHWQYASITRTWLDHSLSSQSIDLAPEEIFICCDNHFPSYVKTSLNNLLRLGTYNDLNNFENNWSFKDEHKPANFHSILEAYLQNTLKLSLCQSVICESMSFKEALNQSWICFTEAVIYCRKTVLGVRKICKPVNPDWNAQPLHM